jgi:uncharacterized protein (TIGR00251 family)
MAAVVYPSWLHPQGEDILLDVFVAPRATRTRIMGVHDGRLKIQLAAPPVDGKANDALVRFIAETLGVARAQVEIVGGPASKRKTVRLAGVPPQRALLALTPTDQTPPRTSTPRSLR